MPINRGRRVITLVAATLFLFSAVAHGFAATAMMPDMGGMAMPGAASDMGMHEDGTHCPPGDCAKDALAHLACFAHCATVMGVLAEPIMIPVSGTGLQLDPAVAYSLTSLHGPPEPPPPKSHA